MPHPTAPTATLHSPPPLQLPLLISSASQQPHPTPPTATLHSPPPSQLLLLISSASQQQNMYASPVSGSRHQESQNPDSAVAPLQSLQLSTYKWKPIGTTPCF
jgi:hypothetical protein